jgi:hypothetical protein
MQAVRARQLAESNYTWVKLTNDVHNACEKLLG